MSSAFRASGRFSVSVATPSAHAVRTVLVSIVTGSTRSGSGRGGHRERRGRPPGDRALPNREDHQRGGKGDQRRRIEGRRVVAESVVEVPTRERPDGRADLVREEDPAGEL